MIASDVLSQARFLTKTSASDGTSDDVTLLRILNDYYLRQSVHFVNTNEDLFGVKATTNLDIQANQEAYTIPSDMLRMKRLEITFDGVKYNKVHMQDPGDVQAFALDATSIGNNFATSDPYAELYGNALYLRPIPSQTVTAGLRLWYIQRPALLSTTSSNISTPQDYHGFLAYGVAKEIALRQGNDSLAANMFNEWEAGIKKIEATFAPRNLDQLVDMKPLPVRYS